jgi:3-isopropylmalate/(R)-2-methylmalate dehydratase large subunit
MEQTLFDKVWDAHIVYNILEYPILYIDRHFIHEVTSPQAFSEIEERKLEIFRKKKITATVDHNVPTTNQHIKINDQLYSNPVKKIKTNCKKHGINLFGLCHYNQGIVHVIGPELGLTLPGITIVCGDSHTSTHGAFGSISFGIGTSQVSMVMASQCLLQKKPKKMRIHLYGKINKEVTPKDVILYIISSIGTDVGTGFFIEFYGQTFKKMTMEGRMTICNMSIEMGAKGGIMAPDNTTFLYLKNKIHNSLFEKYLSYWKTLYSDKKAKFDIEYYFDAKEIEPMITYGTNPGMVIKINNSIPLNKNEIFIKSIKYMGFKPGEYLIGKPVDYVFIGSCTSSRIEDLQLVAYIIKNRKKAKNVKVIIVPGSRKVLSIAIEKGIESIIKQSGLEFREPGCSYCIGMNEDQITEEAYCISTSNRNFEGRQGPKSRTLLSSPLVAAIIAIEGKIVDVNKYIKKYK